MSEERVKVLLIEDNPGDVRLTQLMLAEVAGSEFQFESADRLAAGLERLARRGVDAVLLDLSLPDSHGLETFARLQAADPGAPIVVLSSLDDEDVARQCVQAGAQDYLVKGQTDGRLLAHTLRYAIERKQAERALRESEERFRTLADNISQFAWMADPDGSIFWYNRRWLNYTGAALDEMQGWGWTKVHHPEHVERVVRGIQHSWDAGEPWEDTFPLRGKDGQYRWFLSRALPIRDERGRIARWFGTNTDITERRWTEALLVGERRAFELLARGAPLTTVLETLTRTIEELSGDGLLASILLLDEDGVHLRHGAAPSLPEAYTRAIVGQAIGPSAGSCGTAAYRGEAVVVTDIAADPLWADYRDVALAHGLRACWSTPITGFDGRILGTFALYYRDPRAESRAPAARGARRPGRRHHPRARAGRPDQGAADGDRRFV